MNGLTRKQLAELLDISEGTVRKYERAFDAWLETPPGVKGRPVAKEFLDEDVRTLAVINAMRKEGVSYDAMLQGELDAALASGAYEVDMQNMQERPFDSQAGSELATVPAQQYALVVGQLQATEREYQRLREELETERQAHLEAVERAAAATAVAEERDRLLERLDKIETKLDAAQEELQSERAKSWWDKVRRK
jgi:transcriptional regulator with XRE-family HTH domain